MAKEIWGYARVSTKEQNLERQISELRQYVPKEENIISDKQSGKNFDRPGYKSLRERVREGDELYVKSIYRLGRDKEAIKNELKFLKKKGVLVHILDFPQTMLEIEDEYQLRIVELINTLMIEIFSFIAQEERENIRRRQAEGIAVWRKTGKTKTGRPYGRPKIQFPSNWKKIYALWKEKRLKSKEAWYLLKISKNVFYRLVKEYESPPDVAKKKLKQYSG